jgi:hypothetical protein
VQNDPIDVSVRVTEVDIPVTLPDGAVVGKARIVEGDGEDAVLIELEAKNPAVASMLKTHLIGLSMFYVEQGGEDVEDRTGT